MKLLFDCDGTILDSMHIWLDPINNLLDKYNFNLTKELKGEIEALDIIDTCKWLSKNVAKDMTYLEIKDYFEKNIHDGYAYNLMPKEGAFDIIKKLYEQGFEMAIASSTDVEYLELAFKRLKLYDYFKFMITPNTCPYNKGEVDFWKLACKKLDEKEENVMLFDDALYAVKVAKKAGLKTCGLKDFPYNEKEWEFIQKEADLTLDLIKDIDIEKLK